MCLPHLPRGIPTAGSSRDRHQAQSNCTFLELLLQCGSGVGFYHRLCWLCCNFHLLAKHHPCACLGRWLHAGLDAKEIWHIEDTVLLHLGCCNGHEAVEHLAANLLLQLMFFCESGCQGTLCHCLAATSLHGLHCFHGLHWHDGERSRTDKAAKSLI